MYHVTLDRHCFNGGWVLKRTATGNTIRSLPLGLAQTLRDLLNDDDDAHDLAVHTIRQRSSV